MGDRTKIGYLSAVSIGIGGMVGGGIFAVLGFSVQLSHGGAPISFLIAGIVALVTSYSYAKLSIRYPSEGGTVTFLTKGFGTGIQTGGLNILLWISYVIMLSLYAHAFGSYGSTFFHENGTFWEHFLISLVIVAFTLINFLNVKFVGRSEEIMVLAKIIIILVFIGFGLWSVRTDNLATQTWSSPTMLIAGGMVIFLAYEGFELIANTAKDVENPRKTLPRAFYTAVLFVIGLYVTVAIVTVGNLSLQEIIDSRDFALAESAKPFLGDLGFVFIVIAALLSTSSAINATLYGAAKISYMIAKLGELPSWVKRKMWNKPLEGLILTTGFTLLIANLFDLSSIATIGSGGFLVIFAAVNWINFKLHHKTQSKRMISLLGSIACIASLIVLIYETTKISGATIWFLVAIIGGSFGVELLYKKISGRVIKHDF